MTIKENIVELDSLFVKTIFQKTLGHEVNNFIVLSF